MAPVIRISDQIYKRLEENAIGFDTPTNVIERLIEFYELNSDRKEEILQSVELNKPSARSLGIRKKRDTILERKLKIAVGHSLGWGEFVLKHSSVLEFTNSDRNVLCKYSSLGDHWFWGVSHKYWTNWNDNSYLALIMQNDNKKDYSYLIIKPNDAKVLFSKCSESSGEKKINIRFNQSKGVTHIQEWQEFKIESKIKELVL